MAENVSSALFSYLMPSASDEKSRNSEMSVPAANARVPAPVMTMARTEPSSGTLVQISAKRAYISNVRALNLSGRFRVTNLTGPSLETRT